MSDIDIVRNALDWIRPGTRITSDDLRPALDAAQIPGQQIGPLMGRAVQRGWLISTREWRYSTRRARKHSRLSVYVVADSLHWRNAA